MNCNRWQFGILTVLLIFWILIPGYVTAEDCLIQNKNFHAITDKDGKLIIPNWKVSHELQKGRGESHYMAYDNGGGAINDKHYLSLNVSGSGGMWGSDMGEIRISQKVNHIEASKISSINFKYRYIPPTTPSLFGVRFGPNTARVLICVNDWPIDTYIENNQHGVNTWTSISINGKDICNGLSKINADYLNKLSVVVNVGCGERCTLDICDIMIELYDSELNL